NGGSTGGGTLFRINTDGSGFTVLYNFTNNPDGASPYAPLILSGSTLYGTTQIGGSSGNGTVFTINTDGSGYAVIKSFQNGADGSLPTGGLVQIGNSLFGTTGSGGTMGYGTIFEITLTSPQPCPLHIDRFGTNAVLTWTNPVFSLQMATQAVGNYTTLPTAVSPYTNAIGGTEHFFRLIATP
ncbi:MAG TPA: choice-of-anchor tandem repeat GloVer-containing protein, partial [Verrucomicrobiae bacterium]